MLFLKKNWQLVACAALALAGLGIGAWQATAASAIPRLMEPAVQIGRQLDSAAKGKMVNRQYIDAKKREQAGSQRRFNETLASAQERQTYVAFEQRVGADGTPIRVERKPRVEGVLPAATLTQPRIEFRRVYREEFKRLAERLHAGQPPAEADLVKAIQDWQAQQALLQAFNPWSIQQSAAPAAPEAEAVDRVRVLWNDPVTRKSVERAKSILMYLDANAIAEHPIAVMPATPAAEDIWQAQMSLWIQQDLVTALARLNDAAAARLKAEGRAWVAYMPIKRLRALSIAPMLGPPGGGGSNTPANGWAFPSFIGRNNDDKIFVVALQVAAVIEANALPQVLDALVGISFMTPVRLEYHRVPVDPAQHGFVYGSAKLMDVQIDLEAYYLHSVYKKWMPPDVAEALTRPMSADLSAGQTGAAPPAGGGGGRR